MYDTPMNDTQLLAAITAEVAHLRSEPATPDTAARVTELLDMAGLLRREIAEEPLFGQYHEEVRPILSGLMDGTVSRGALATPVTLPDRTVKTVGTLTPEDLTAIGDFMAAHARLAEQVLDWVEREAEAAKLRERASEADLDDPEFIADLRRQVLREIAEQDDQ